VTSPVAATAATPIPSRSGVAAPAVTTATPVRRRYGQIPQLVLAHLAAYPQLDFSPYELAKVLRASHGTVRRHLLHLADAGRVRRTRVAPARFQAL
jgi:hypothetical protein